MRNLLPLFLLTGILCAQTAPSPEIKDSRGRDTPQGAVFQFLEACHSGDYSKATYFLDLRQLPASQRSQNGPELARQLEDLLDDTSFDLATLSRDPSGDQSDGISTELEHLATFHIDGQTLELQLERVQLKAGLLVWLVSAPSVAMIPEAHKIVAETPFERKLPQDLVRFEILATPVWRWIALVLVAAGLWLTTGVFTWLLSKMERPLAAARFLRGPFRLGVAVAGFRAALDFATPSSLPRFFIERACGLIFFLALAWGAAMAIDLLGERWHSHLDPRIHAVSYSVLPLGRQILKLALYMLAFLTVISGWGYNTSAILAGLGVGGLAVALAAQKTIENLFGGISVIGDRPVLVGDVCRFGDRTGTVMHIGLRSTRIRTPDRTIISVPNSQFSSMSLENISGRDKIWFHPTFNLRRDTTSSQLSQVLSSLQKILLDHPKVEVGNLPVRFIGVGAYSLDIEVNAYVTTLDADEFLALQQALLLQMLQAVEAAGTALAVPLQESFNPQRPPQNQA